MTTKTANPHDAKAEERHVTIMPSSASEQPRQPGLSQGILSDEFFDPLPEEELAAWEGKSG